MPLPDRRVFRLHLFLALLSAVLTVRPAAAQDVFVEGGTLIDPDAQTARVANLLILDGKIAGHPEHPPEGFDGELVDAAGRWVIPGLRDLHVHSEVNQGLGGPPERLGTAAASRRMLYAGVTGFLDLFHLEDTILGLRSRQQAARNETGWGEDAWGADIHAAGPCLTAPEGHCTEYRIPTRLLESPEDARREVAELAAKGPDVVKLVYEHPSPEVAARSFKKARPTLDLPTFAAAVAEAAKHGIPTVVHIRSWGDIEDAADVGATAVTHLPSYAALPEGVAEKLAEAGTVVIPTLAVGDPSLAVEKKRLDDPLLRALAPAALFDSYRKIDVTSERFAPMVRGMEAARVRRLEALRQLADAGVTLVAGTDSGNPFTVHGYSLHRELALMVEAGLTPRQALAAATTEAGRFLGKSWGLAEGDEGTVVLLDASPLEDITHTRRIHAVIHHGRVVDREGLGLGLGLGLPKR